MSWTEADPLTRAAMVMAALGVVLMVFPPLGMASLLVAAVLSGTALSRARRRGDQNRMARLCLAAAAGLILAAIVGSALYAAASS